MADRPFALQRRLLGAVSHRRQRAVPGALPDRALPVAYIAAAVVGYVAVCCCRGSSEHVSFPTLLMLNLGALLSLTSAFWIVRRFTNADWVVFLMFVAVGPMFSLIQLGYWGLAGRLFDLRQAKRLFGLVGAGEEVSTIVGLFSTPLLIRLVGGTGNLVLLAAAGLAGSFVTVVLIWRISAAASTAGSEAAGATPRAACASSICSSVRYFLLMAACAILIKLALYTIDFSFLAQIRHPVPGAGADRAVLRRLLRRGEDRGVAAEGPVSGPLLSQFGLNVGLLLLPILLSVSAGSPSWSAASGSATRTSSCSSRCRRWWRWRAGSRSSSRPSACSISRSPRRIESAISPTSRGRPAARDRRGRRRAVAVQSGAAARSTRCISSTAHSDPRSVDRRRGDCASRVSRPLVPRPEGAERRR